jgi:glucokinase
VDLGASKVALALGDAGGGVRARWQRPTEPSGDPARDVARLLDDARAFLTAHGVAPGGLHAVGVAAPGPLDRARGALLGPPNLPGWNDVPLRDALADGLDAPAHLENDASAAALAEWRFGAGRGFRDLVYLSMSTGVGGGLVLGGRLHAGVSGNAGEWGHVPVEWEGEPCACGRRGCLEAYTGGAAWTRRLRAEAPADSRALALAGARTALAPEHVIAAAREGDAFARAELERWNAYLARGVELVVQALAPQAVVLGTIAAAAGELCLAPVRARVAARVWPVLGRGLQIVAAGLGEELPYRSGLCVALQASEGS